MSPQMVSVILFACFHKRSRAMCHCLHEYTLSAMKCATFFITHFLLQQYFSDAPTWHAAVHLVIIITCVSL